MEFSDIGFAAKRLLDRTSAKTSDDQARGFESYYYTILEFLVGFRMQMEIGAHPRAAVWE
jgi:hypothetical protein